MTHDTHEPTVITEEILRPWLELVTRDRPKALEYYFEHILPLVIRKTAENPDHQRLRRREYHTLISLMGFSPETTVICSAVLRPQRLLIVYGAPDDPHESAKVDLSINMARQYLESHKIFAPVQIEHVSIKPTDPIDIYKKIRNAIQQAPTIDDNKSAIVDVTGGKKVMSATAGQVAWEMGLPLCYVEGKFNELLKRPEPGTEEVLRLLNPSQQQQYQMRIDAMHLYSNRNYSMAVDAFDRCRQNRVENRLDDVAADLCRAYVRWTDLDLPQLKEEIESTLRRTHNQRVKLLFDEKEVSITRLREHLAVLERVANAEPLAMIASFMELAELYGSDAYHRNDFACLLTYRCMEAVVEHGLRAVFGASFDRSNPWKNMDEEEHEALEASYAKLSSEVDRQPSPDREYTLPRRVGFVAGLALLCVKADLAKEMDMKPASLINRMRSVAELRNESVLTHGTRTLSRDDFLRMNTEAVALAKAILRDEFAVVEELRAGMQPAELDDLAAE